MATAKQWLTAQNKIKNLLLGEDYDLSFAFVGERRSRELNRLYRGPNRPTNVLSFPLTPRSGEILICRPQARREAKVSGRKTGEYFQDLLIHGLLHLKGFRHGSKMSRQEKKLSKLFSHYVTGHHNRIRSRHLGDKINRLRGGRRRRPPAARSN